MSSDPTDVAKAADGPMIGPERGTEPCGAQLIPKSEACPPPPQLSLTLSLYAMVT